MLQVLALQEALLDMTEEAKKKPFSASVRTAKSKAAKAKYLEGRGVELEARKKAADKKKAQIVATGGMKGGGMKYTAIAMAGRAAEGSEY